MGDVVSLVEKAEEAVNADEAAELTKRMMTGGRAAGVRPTVARRPCLASPAAHAPPRGVPGLEPPPL
jgi:hypothetical protein